MKSLISKKRAQALTEYVLILGLVCVFCMLFARVSQEIITRTFENFVFIYSLPVP